MYNIVVSELQYERVNWQLAVSVAIVVYYYIVLLTANSTVGTICLHVHIVTTA